MENFKTKKIYPLFVIYYLLFFSIKMSIMILIDASKLNSIRAQFIRNKNIINKDKFVEILLFNLPESLKADKKFNRTNVVKEILKLFKQVNFYLFYY